jgi:phosphonoacetate hydrolase
MSGAQRLVIGLIDGWGLDYYEKSDMPRVRDLAALGWFRPGRAVFPTLTNVNNWSLICGAWPETHGLNGNCYYDAVGGRLEFIESPEHVRCETIFGRAAHRGVKSALLTCKAKTAQILGDRAAFVLAAQQPDQAALDRHGPPPDIYSRAVNYWLWSAAVDLLENRPDIGLIYVHTTDYPMHRWGPDEAESLEHLSRLDQWIGRAVDAAPDAAFILTADHGMRPKTRAWDLVRACRNRGLPIKYALSPVADRLFKHHLGLGGASYVYLEDQKDRAAASALIAGLEGIEEVVAAGPAAARWRLHPERLGDLMVTAGPDTVLGTLEEERIRLPAGYRSHGSRYESDIPLLVYNADRWRPPTSEPIYNLELTTGLYR